MQGLGQSDAILLGIAVYIAVMSLVRLMRRRRDQLVADVQRQVADHRKRTQRAAEERLRKAA